MRPKVWFIGGAILYFATQGAEFLHELLKTSYPMLDTLLFTLFLLCVYQLCVYVYKMGVIKKEKNNR